MVKGDNAVSTARLTLRHTFMPKIPVDFAGPSYFGGKDDQLVLCASKGIYYNLSKNIHIISSKRVIYISGIVYLLYYYVTFEHKMSEVT